MPTPADYGFAADLAEVRRGFIRSLEPRIVRLRELLPSLEVGSGTRESRAEIQAIAHKLAGSCASFGFETMGDAAMTLEDKLIDARTEPRVVLARDVEDLIDLCAHALIETSDFAI
jgi:HPt (histidine-containing phosphotransfer) domain-containing protein